MSDLLTLIQADGFSFKRVASTHGGEYAGSCPWCGGNDRFLIWPQYKSGRYWCRGCEKKGDAIQYIRDTRNLTFPEACDYLGISRAGYRKRRRRKSTELQKEPAFQPKEIPAPPTLWMQKAAAFLKYSQEKLWSPEGETSLEFLHGKGLTEETIRRAGIGFNPSDLYRDRRGWGLLQEIRPDGKPKLIWLPAGIIVPLQDKEGRVVRLRVRRSDPSEGQARYVIVAGSSLAPMVLNPDKGIFVIVESELDACLVHQEAGDLAGIVALGAVGYKPDASCHNLLTKAEKILISLDYDEAGMHYSWKFWPEVYGSKAIRWPVPFGKDPSDAWQEGLDIQAWILAGLDE